MISKYLIFTNYLQHNQVIRSYLELRINQQDNIGLAL